MNLNDFVVLPNNKAKSVKLNARNLQELHMETVTLAQESKEMEDKLQELKESMSKEKEERGHSGGFRWKSGQFGSLNSNALTNGSKKNKENLLQKLSAGKVKIRVLKDEPLTAPPQPPPPPPPDTISLRTTRKNRLRGTYCGQCEVKTAGLMCAECTEDYCIGCFTKFHQKGALKLHRMIPIQKDLQTHVSTRDVVSCFQKQINPSSYPSTFINPNPNPSPNSNAITRRGDQSPEKGTEAVAKPMQLHPYSSQVLAVDHRDEEKVEMIEEGQDERRFPTSLLRGEYNEEESARSFQEALKQWRVESDEAGEPTSEDAMWTPIRPVSVSAMATQADLAPDRGDEGRGREGGAGKVPVRVEFTENSLTYMDRLLLKKHRRTPIKTYRPSLAFGTDLKSLPNTNTGEKTASSLTAQEEDFRRYCASLFAVPVSRGRTEPQITSPEPCLVIEILDERDKDGNFVAQERPCNNRKVPSVQQVLSKLTLVPQVGLISSGASRVSYSSQLSSAQPSRQSRAPAQPKAAQKLHLSEPQTSQAEHSMKSSSSKNVIKYPPLAVKMEENEELSTDSSDEMSSDSLGLAPHEEDSSDEEAQMHGCFTGGRSREEEQGNPAISHTEDPFVPADADREKDLQTDEQEQLSEPSMEDTCAGRTANPPRRCEMLSPAPGVMHDQSSGSRSEQFCDLDGFPPLGLDINSGHSETPKHTHCDPLHTCQTSLQDSDPTGSEGYRPCSTLTTDTEEHLVFRVMDNHLKLTGSQFHSTRPSKRGEISANKLGTSGSGSSLSGKSTPTVSHRPKTNPSPLSSPISPPLSHFPSPPLSACLSRASGSKFGPEFRPFSRAAREIMEICSVDQTGCEDPDLDTDTTAHALHGLEQELRLMANETGKQASVFGTGNSGSQDQHGNHRFTQGRASEEQKDEEDAAAQRDRQSVLSLP
ncbi:hypothetical protein PFLUV_G00020630 [Perca fluviatilis]|uniref:B box-type domain-containing protein n=1 Tax=Perca fluviatilis TaxID=8168 RepID=A0A6A5FLZ8_PERFL|nr:hypothetical protein PFLUV_G00020630 [Perca fluviatilis]